jgi:hypothetical protein
MLDRTITFHNTLALCKRIGTQDKALQHFLYHPVYYYILQQSALQNLTYVKSLVHADGKCDAVCLSVLASLFQTPDALLPKVIYCRYLTAS